MANRPLTKGSTLWLEIRLSVKSNRQEYELRDSAGLGYSALRKIFKTKYLPYKADQVIVNEYLKNQGISKHIDCVPCFKDGIASLSLLEGWEIIFSNARKEEKYALELYPRSLLILTGEARYQWTHEIPKRASEPNGRVRGRRVSITFRAVQLKD